MQTTITTPSYRGFDPSISEDKIVGAAITKYERACERDGVIFMQPGRRDSEVVGDRVILRNTNGELARYRGESDADGRFRLIRIVPKSS